jgi:hypothetical protein
MSPLGRLLASALLVALVLPSAASAGRGDPHTKLTRADNARAKSMLVRKSDLGAGFVGTRAERPDSDFYCRALDESDLTVTGKAVAPTYRSGFVWVASYADVYGSIADASASWRRGTSSAGRACLRRGTREEIRRTGLRFVSFEKIGLPRLAQESIAFRAIAERDGVRAFVDVVALRQTRAFAAISLGSLGAPIPKPAVVRIARIVSDRMARAMRGG